MPVTPPVTSEVLSGPGRLSYLFCSSYQTTCMCGREMSLWCHLSHVLTSSRLSETPVRGEVKASGEGKRHRSLHPPSGCLPAGSMRRLFRAQPWRLLPAQWLAALLQKRNVCVYLKSS